MLADNRDVIADILEGLARRQPLIGWDAHFARGRLWRGADTLRWAAAFDATPTGEELVELDRLRAFLETVEPVLDRVKVDGKREHPAAKLTAIRAAYGALS